MLHTVAIRGYRSLRDIVLPLSRLTVITGANGTGKSSLYRALRLLADCGRGEVTGSLAREGGLDSVLWAGPEQLGGARRTGRVEGTVRCSPVSVAVHDGLFDLQLQQRGTLRPLRAAELSDGTLRFLLWAAALLSPQPPSLMVLNEPETSLHPDLVRPLASLIGATASQTQVVVVTHSRAMLEFLNTVPVSDTADAADAAEDGIAVEIGLYKELGETRVEGLGMLTTPPWIGESARAAAPAAAHG
jgi:predicted ATPase